MLYIDSLSCALWWLLCSFVHCFISNVVCLFSLQVRICCFKYTIVVCVVFWSTQLIAVTRFKSSWSLYIGRRGERLRMIVLWRVLLCMALGAMKSVVEMTSNIF